MSERSQLPPELSHLQQLEPVVRSFMAGLLTQNGKPLPEMSVAEAREYMQAAQATPFEGDEVAISTVELAGVRCVVVRPAQSTLEILPIVLYLHGGGWVLGAPETHARLTRAIACGAHAAVVVPDYARAPEQPYPAALHQVSAIADSLRAGALPHTDGQRIAVAGDSAGGNLAAAAALLQVQRSGEPGFCLQALICPALLASGGTASYAAYSEGFNLPAEVMRWFWQQYAPDIDAWQQPLVSPLLATDDTLARVAPAFIVTAGCDVLRDEAEQFGQRLLMAGNEATVMRCEATVHNFPVIDDLKTSGPSVAATAALCAALRRAWTAPHSQQRNLHEAQ